MTAVMTTLRQLIHEAAMCVFDARADRLLGRVVPLCAAAHANAGLVQTREQRVDTRGHRRDVLPDATVHLGVTVLRTGVVVATVAILHAALSGTA
jgi:hypothetical protein